MHDWEQACSLHDRASYLLLLTWTNIATEDLPLSICFLFMYISIMFHIFWERDIAHDDLYMQVDKLQQPNT